MLSVQRLQLHPPYEGIGITQLQADYDHESGKAPAVPRGSRWLQTTSSTTLENPRNLHALNLLVQTIPVTY